MPLSAARVFFVFYGANRPGQDCARPAILIHFFSKMNEAEFMLLGYLLDGCVTTLSPDMKREPLRIQRIVGDPLKLLLNDFCTSSHAAIDNFSLG